MKEEPCSEAPERSVDPYLIEAALTRAVREAVLKHAKLGHPVAAWRDGKVVWLQPDEVLELLARKPAP